MRLRQMFLALILVPAIEMSVSAQRVLGETGETGDAPTQTRPVESAAAPGDAPKEGAPAPAASKEGAANAAAPKEGAAAPAALKEGAAATEARAASLSPAPVPTPLRRHAFKNDLYADSYADAYKILGEDNACSRFFGGAANATRVLNSLAGRLGSKRFDNPNVAVEMSGAVELVHDRRTGASYRLFERALVNNIGPLFVAPVLAKAHRRAIGRFPSDTRAARALILLHELGHLVRGADGRWLLPNDGHDAQLSVRNTSTVESQCLKQLTALKY